MPELWTVCFRYVVTGNVYILVTSGFPVWNSYPVKLQVAPFDAVISRIWIPDSPLVPANCVKFVCA